MTRTEKIKRWALITATASISIAGVLVLMVGLIEKDLTYEPGFLAAAAAILLTIQQLTGNKWILAPGAVFAIASGFLWMKDGIESPEATATALVIFVSIMTLGLVIFGILAFYAWIAQN